MSLYTDIPSVDLELSIWYNYGRNSKMKVYDYVFPCIR